MSLDRNAKSEASPRKPRAKSQLASVEKVPAVRPKAVAAPAKAKAAASRRPGLDDLHGLEKAKEWGLSLAQDIKEYRAGTLSWDDVDRGCVLHGPPGVGKTTFGKAVADKCGVHFIATSYSVWQRYREGHLGHVLSAIREDFRRAKEKAPSILLIDEIDCIPSRDNLSPRFRDWWDAIVAALLQELDGISDRDGVVVIAACNYPDRIDAALVRAGRLDTHIAITLPSINELVGIIRFHLRGSLPDADLRPVAVCAAGMTGADVEKLVRDARRVARRQRRALELADLLKVLEVDAVNMPSDCLYRVALHEAGHAVAAIVLDASSDVTVSLVRRGNIVAETSLAPRTQAITRKVVEKTLAVTLAGRAAEKVLLGEVTAGAGGNEKSDLAVATGLAIRAVGSWGLSSTPALAYSDETALDQLRLCRPELAAEVEGMLEAAYADAQAMIACHSVAVRTIAAALLERRALTHQEILDRLPPIVRGGDA